MHVQARKAVMDWVDGHREAVSSWNQTIWHFGEAAWREYRFAAWYVDLLREQGFEMEAGSGGMPTAFCATWTNGTGPVIAGYAEYDGVPGNCQAANTVKEPRAGLSEHTRGHTDPHSALGISSLAGFLATKAAMQADDIPGTLRFFGEPAEKVRGSKPIHAARGYYDGVDAFISFHPFYMMPLCNTVCWNTHCGAGYGMVYRFLCDEPETWLRGDPDAPIAQSHASARAPGATDTLLTFLQATRTIRDSMRPKGAGCSISETILSAGQATADNLPARLAEVQLFIRVPEVESAVQMVGVIDRAADAAAGLSHCRFERHWGSKSRPGLPNHALARATYDNLQSVGVLRWSEAAIEIARKMQRNLGLEPMESPLLEACEQLIDPEIAEAELRRVLPPEQKNFTSDDYTEYCWHAPTVRLYVARPALKAPPGYAYPDWVMNALGGIAETIDPMIDCASRTVGLTAVDLLTRADLLASAREEFVQRTGGGVGGKDWVAPLCDYDPPLHFRWPEYVTTARGEDWCIPTPVNPE